MERSIFSLASFAQQDYFEICPTLSHVSVHSFSQWSCVPRPGWASLADPSARPRMFTLFPEFGYNKAAVNVQVQVLRWTRVFTSLG